MTMSPKFRALVVGAFVCAAASVASTARAQQDVPLEKRIAKARDIVQKFTDKLRAELTSALKSGPAAHAIDLCQTLSPDLTAQIADEGQVEITRVALKLRNPENAPDEWEEKVLLAFQAQAATGADVGKLEHHEIVTSPEGDRLFRYMRAIPVGEMCLTCHGTDVRTDVKAEIARLYPEDKALGFKLGELRGAFSLVQLINE